MAKERMSLGTGLSALFGDEKEVDTEKTLLPITKIEPRSEQPRNTFDEEALQSLSESISRHGMIQPITVRKLETGFYQIIAGERRWRAARLAGLLEIPVNIIEADDRKTAELALVENLQREDLNPIEEALGYKKLIEDYGLTQEETAGSVGKSRSTVTNSLRLLNPCASVLRLVEEGSLSAGHARTLLPLSNEKLQLNAANQIIEKGLSVRSTERLVANLINSEKKKDDLLLIDSEAVDYYKELSSDLSKTLGRKVLISSGRKNGKIELEFYGEEDREALIESVRKFAKKI